MADAHEDPHSTQMKLGFSRIGSAVVVSVAGEVDMLTAPRLSDAMNSAWDRADAGAPIVVDLSRVTFLDSHGLTTLAEASSTARRAGRPLRLVVGEARMVILPLRVSGLDTRLALYPSIGDALADRDACADRDDGTERSVT
jgi:anti-sigma B factor antagonist